MHLYRTGSKPDGLPKQNKNRNATIKRVGMVEDPVYTLFSTRPVNFLVALVIFTPPPPSTHFVHVHMEAL